MRLIALTLAAALCILGLSPVMAQQTPLKFRNQFASSMSRPSVA
jgi:hypothetical protein